jgi:hypothetical protein
LSYQYSGAEIGEIVSVLKKLFVVQDIVLKINQQYIASAAQDDKAYVTTADLPKDEINRMINELEKQMKAAAQALEFEKAALLRDQVIEMRQIMVLKGSGKGAPIPEWEKIRKLEEAGVEYSVD